MWKLRKYNLLNRHQRPIRKVPVIRKGDFVKLVFEFDKPIEDVHAERMRVEVSEINGNHFIGNLNNDPLYLTEIKDGDKVEFTKQNIFDVDNS